MNSATQLFGVLLHFDHWSAPRFVLYAVCHQVQYGEISCMFHFYVVFLLSVLLLYFENCYRNAMVRAVDISMYAMGVECCLRSDVCNA